MGKRKRLKVLLGLATYPTLPHVYKRTEESITAAVETAQAAGLNVTVQRYDGDDPRQDKYGNLMRKHNQMRQDVLGSGYDALFMVEADMIIPADALIKLAVVEADVVYSLYCSRHSGIWLCFPQIDGFNAVSLNANREQAKRLLGTVISSEGVGFGCTLIQRRVLEAIEFQRMTNRHFADDWHFAVDVKTAGFRSASHLGVVCGHIVKEGVIMWPDVEVPDGFRREETEAEPAGMPLPRQAAALPAQATYHVLKPISGPERDYLAGDTIELDAEAAAIFLERGAIEATADGAATPPAADWRLRTADFRAEQNSDSGVYSQQSAVSRQESSLEVLQEKQET